jgi:hypothetical protein
MSSSTQTVGAEATPEVAAGEPTRPADGNASNVRRSSNGGENAIRRVVGPSGMSVQFQEERGNRPAKTWPGKKPGCVCKTQRCKQHRSCGCTVHADSDPDGGTTDGTSAGGTSAGEASDGSIAVAKRQKAAKKVKIPPCIVATLGKQRFALHANHFTSTIIACSDHRAYPSASSVVDLEHEAFTHLLAPHRRSLPLLLTEVKRLLVNHSIFLRERDRQMVADVRSGVLTAGRQGEITSMLALLSLHEATDPTGEAEDLQAELELPPGLPDDLLPVEIYHPGDESWAQGWHDGYAVLPHRLQTLPEWGTIIKHVVSARSMPRIGTAECGWKVDNAEVDDELRVRVIPPYEIVQASPCASASPLGTAPLSSPDGTAPPWYTNHLS